MSHIFEYEVDFALMVVEKSEEVDDVRVLELTENSDLPHGSLHNLG